MFILSHLLTALLTEAIINLYQMAEKFLQSNVEVHGWVKNSGNVNQVTTPTNLRSAHSGHLTLTLNITCQPAWVRKRLPGRQTWVPTRGRCLGFRSRFSFQLHPCWCHDFGSETFPALGLGCLPCKTEITIYLLHSADASTKEGRQAQVESSRNEEEEPREKQRPCHSRMPSSNPATEDLKTTYWLAAAAILA